MRPDPGDCEYAALVRTRERGFFGSGNARFNCGCGLGGSAMAADATTAMTIDFLRARLLSERSVSRAAKERADHLARRVSARAPLPTAAFPFPAFLPPRPRLRRSRSWRSSCAR